MALLALTAVRAVSGMKKYSRARPLPRHVERSWEVVDHKFVHSIFTLEDDEGMCRPQANETRS